MFFSIRVLKSAEDILVFKDKFCHLISYEIPYSYFLDGDCYGLFVDSKLVGGYCLVSGPVLNLRSLRQIPFNQFEMLVAPYDEAISEFTGYFLEDKRFGLLFTMHLVWTVLFHKSKLFVYSYPASQKRLEKYYAKGSPIRIYSGVPEYLEGHSNDMEKEHVEILTKKGIIKIFLHRTWKYLKTSVGAKG